MKQNNNARRSFLANHLFRFIPHFIAAVMWTGCCTRQPAAKPPGSVPVAPQPTANSTTPLFDAVYQALIKAAPQNADHGALADQANKITAQCGSLTTNPPVFWSTLASNLSQTGVSSLANYSDALNAAADISTKTGVPGIGSAAVAAPPAAAPAPAAPMSATDQKLNDLSNEVSAVTNELSTLTKGMTNADAIFSPYLHAEAGTTILQPFEISPYQEPNGPLAYQLKLGSADVRGMVQVVFEDRYAWRNDFVPGDPMTTNRLSTNVWGFNGLDFEARIGYAFGGSSAQSGATAGSGDFYGDLSLGLPLWAQFTRETNCPAFSQTLGPGLFTTFASDSQYSQIHFAGGAGLVYAAGIPLQGFGLPQQKAQFMLRAGAALVDSPSIISAGTNGLPLVGLNGDGTPRFTSMGAAAVAAELRFPIQLSGKQFGFLSLGGTGYVFGSREEPDQWSLYVAVSFNLGRIVSTVIPSN